MSIFLGSGQPTNIYLGSNQVQTVYSGNNLVYNSAPPPYDGIVTSGLYIDYRQSTYVTGSGIWSSSVAISSSISGTFSSLPSVVSSSVLFNSTTNLTSTYISASEAHAAFTVVVYAKYNSPGNNAEMWDRSNNLYKRWLHNGEPDRYWIINSTGTDYGLDEVSGSVWTNANFFVDTLVGTGSSFIQYQNQALTQNNNTASPTRTNWATNGASSGFRMRPFPSYVKRVLVYDRGLTAAEVLQNYNALTGSNN